MDVLLKYKKDTKGEVLSKTGGDLVEMWEIIPLGEVQGKLNPDIVENTNSYDNSLKKYSQQ